MNRFFEHKETELRERLANEFDAKARAAIEEDIQINRELWEHYER